MISKKELGGRWRIKDQTDREKISKHLKNISGVAKTRLEYFKESNKFPTLKIDNIMHDGEFRDQVIYQKITIREPILEKKQDEIVFYYEKANVDVSYGRLYTIAQDHNCEVDVNATFKILENKHINSTILLTSDGSCFPEEMVFEVEYPNPSAVSKRRVINYVVLLSMLLVGF